MASVQRIAINRALREPKQSESGKRKSSQDLPLTVKFRAIRCTYTKIDDENVSNFNNMSMEMSTIAPIPRSIINSQIHPYHTRVRRRIIQREQEFASSKLHSYYHHSPSDYPLPAPQESKSLVDYVNCRNVGNGKLQNAKVSKNYGTRRLLEDSLLMEKTYYLDKKINKVFCSQWLTDRQVIIGTKCNKIFTMDIQNGRTFKIPKIKSRPSSPKAATNCGIHSIQLNPGKTLLATGGKNTNDIGIYKIPTLDPYSVCEGGHFDWMFDVAWLDDELLASGSRDSSIALWSINSDHNSSFYKEPILVKSFEDATKIRSLAFNDRTRDLVALSLNARLQILDPETLKRKRIINLPDIAENVCMTQEKELEMYAIGSRRKISIFDSRNLGTIFSQYSKYPGCGIRSLSFLENLLTIGTGNGCILFFDVRMNRYLDRGRFMTDRKCDHLELRTSVGWVKTDDFYYDLYTLGTEYKPAIYTHSYDISGTKLFIAGGPLPANIQGNFAALWH